MPRLGGFGRQSLGGALVNNVVGSAAAAIFPQGVFATLTDGVLGNNQLFPFPNQSEADRRVSLRPRAQGRGTALGDGLLNPLKETNFGIVFPYTPSINYTHSIDYQTMQMVHSIQDFHMYSKTAAVPLSIDSTFTVQNQKEGAYAMACIHFLRTMAKMNFGEKDPRAGTPPPILLFNAYGPFVFKDLPVIVNTFTVNFPDDVDYVLVGAQGTQPAQVVRALQQEVQRGGPDEQISRQELQRLSRPQTTTSASQYQVWLPSMFKISVGLIVQHTPRALRQDFNLPKFINGSKDQQSFI